MKRLGDMYYSGTLPVTLAFVDNRLTWYSIYGNMVQNGTPTQDNPIVPQECGDLVSSGEHAGEYSLTFTSDNVTTNIYLSEPIRKIGNYVVDTVEESHVTAMVYRVIRKKVFDGTEAFSNVSSGANRYFRVLLNDYPCTNDNNCLCTHFVPRSVASANTLVGVRAHVPSSVGAAIAIRPENVSNMTVDDFKAWLASEYANGTPVTVWYELETPVDESITATPIPVSGETTIDYDGTLAPSRFAINIAYGWDDVSLRVYTNSEWVKYKEKKRVNGEWV